MTVDPGLLNRLRSRGEEVLTQVSAELSSNPRFMRAMAVALRGKEQLEQSIARVLRQMNVPSRSELKRALSRIDALERELAALKTKARARPRSQVKAKPRPKRAAPPSGSAAGG